MNGFTFNLQHSSILGIELLSYYDSLIGSIDNAYIRVPERSGSYSRFMGINDKQIKVKMVLFGTNTIDLNNKLREVSYWLFTKHRVSLSFDAEPDKYYMAQLDGDVQVANFGNFCEIEATFKCEPFAYGILCQQIVNVDNPTFTRATVAYKQDASQVASGVARYENGYFQNLLTDNQATGGDTLGNITGFNPNIGTETLSRDSANFWQGTGSIKVVCNGAVASQGIYTTSTSVISGQTYTASAWIKGASGTIKISIGSNSAIATLNGTWQRIFVTGVAEGPLVDINILTDVAQAITFYIDGLQLEEGSTTKSWILPSTGKALTIEEGTTNIALYSDPASTGQLASNSGITFATGIISNLTNAVVFATNSVNRWAYVGTTLAINTTYTVSVFVKMDDGTVPVVGQGAAYDFTLTGNGFALSAPFKVDSIGGGVYHVSGQFTTGGTVVSPSAGIIKYTTNSAKTFKCSGFQVEAKGHVTSYMATSGATAARGNELITFPLTGGTLNVSTGSIGGRFYLISNPTGAIPILFSTSDLGAPGPRLIIGVNGSKITVWDADGATEVVYQGTTTLLSNTWYDFEFTYSATNGRKLYLNGVLEASNARNTSITITSTGKLGSQIGYYLNGLIDDFFMSQKEMSQAEVTAFHGATTSRTPDSKTTYSLAFDTTLTAGVSNIVPNEGTAESSPYLEVLFVKAGCTDFKIQHLESSRFIRVINNFALNDVLVIDFEKSVITINGVRAMNKLDLNSYFFKLNPGDNTLTSTTTGASGTNVKAQYIERWL